MGDKARRIDRPKVELCSSFADSLVGLGMLGKSNQCPARTEDAGLLPGDLGDRVAQVILVIKCDVRDDGEDRVDNVGRVQSSSQTDLKNRNFDRICISASVFSITGKIEESQ